jgi:iron(II)-dependent oxidoreductase
MWLASTFPQPITIYKSIARPSVESFYTWGDVPDLNRVHDSDSGSGSTSAEGCFPDGASPYNVEELSGNVWAWTRRLDGDDPDPADCNTCIIQVRNAACGIIGMLQKFAR